MPARKVLDIERFVTGRVTCRKCRTVYRLTVPWGSLRLFQREEAWCADCTTDPRYKSRDSRDWPKDDNGIEA